MEKVTMAVGPDGKTTIKAEGFDGDTCVQATEIFEQMFGKTVTEREMVSDGGCNPDLGERVR